MARTSKEDKLKNAEVTETNIAENRDIKLVALENIKSGVNYYAPGDVFNSTDEEANYLIEVGAAAYTDKE